MANIRELKKEIENRTYEVVADCMTHGLLHEKHKKKSDGIMTEALELQENLIRKVNEKPGKDSGSAKEYYGRIRQELHENVNKQFGKLSKLVQEK